jgi:L-ascorbate metabolism protein UlaG (beta-lactamase superfamily)
VNVRPVPSRPTRSLVVLALALSLVGCAGVGDPTPGAPPHHRTRGFVNAEPGHPQASAWVRTWFLVTRIWSSTFSPRAASLPVLDNDGAALREAGGPPRLTWIGHATLLIQLDGVNILTDPQFSDRASPFSWAGPKRVTRPGLRFEDLPPIHLVLVSHDHYDHLDVATLTRLAREHRPRFLAPLGLQSWLADIGITDVEELDWWDSRTVRELTLTCVPAQHFSGRTLWDRDRRLWSGWAVAGKARRLYFSGDTAHAAHMRQIGERLGPFDVAAIAIGAYLPPVIMQPVHVTPEEALQLFEDVRGRVFVPIHWGTFDLAEEPIEEPPLRLAAEAERRRLGPDRVWVLKHGETRPW